RHAPDVQAVARSGPAPQLGMTQAKGIRPFPAPEVARAAVEQLVGQCDVVVEVFAVRQVDAADGVAAAERLGALGGLDRLDVGAESLLLRPLALPLGPLLLAADQDNPGG